MFSTTFNKSVFAVKIKDYNTIIKVNMQWFNQVKTAEKSLAKPSAMFNGTDFFNDIVATYFGRNCSKCTQLVEKLIIMADSDNNGITTSKEAAWFGSLLLTQETFMLAALNESTSTIALTGYCGALYAVEKVHISSSHMVDTSSAFADFWSLPEFAEPIESFFKDILGDLRDSYAWFQELHEYVYVFIKRLRRDKVLSLDQRLQFILGNVFTSPFHGTLFFLAMNILDLLQVGVFLLYSLDKTCFACRVLNTSSVSPRIVTKPDDFFTTNVEKSRK